METTFIAKVDSPLGPVSLGEDDYRSPDEDKRIVCIPSVILQHNANTSNIVDKLKNVDISKRSPLFSRVAVCGSIQLCPSNE